EGLRRDRHARACRGPRWTPRGGEPLRRGGRGRLGGASAGRSPGSRRSRRPAEGRLAMKVLLVDDHAVVREGVRRLLSELPAVEITEAGSGPEALTSFRRDRPDVVLLDLNLPGMTGLELLRRLKAEDER